MPASPAKAADVLNREFLELRCRLLDLAAGLDRLQRADGSVEDDPRMKRLREAIEVLRDGQPDRAEQMQLVFSRPYDDDWQTQFGLPAR
jgi:hypothetical protein